MKVHRISPEAAVPANRDWLTLAAREQFFVGEVKVQPVVPAT